MWYHPTPPPYILIISPSLAAVTSLVSLAITLQAASCWYSAWDNSDGRTKRGGKNNDSAKLVQLIQFIILASDLKIVFIFLKRKMVKFEFIISQDEAERIWVHTYLALLFAAAVWGWNCAACSHPDSERTQQQSHMLTLQTNQWKSTMLIFDISSGHGSVSSEFHQV